MLLPKLFSTFRGYFARNMAAPKMMALHCSEEILRWYPASQAHLMENLPIDMRA